MSQPKPPPSSHGRPDGRHRRLSMIQDTAVDDLHDIDTHALDDKSPPPHHESSLMSYMESHSPNDESSHQCTPKSPLLSRHNSAGDEEKMVMVLEARKATKNGPQGKEDDSVGRSSAPSAQSLDMQNTRTPEAAVDVRKEV